jgi:hypothetical protein
MYIDYILGILDIKRYIMVYIVYITIYNILQILWMVHGGGLKVLVLP